MCMCSRRALCSVVSAGDGGGRALQARASSVRGRPIPGQLRRTHLRRRRRLQQRPGAGLRAPTAAPRHPQARLRSCSASRTHVLRAQTTHRPATPTEALQDSVHQGAHPSTPDCT